MILRESPLLRATVVVYSVDLFRRHACNSGKYEPRPSFLVRIADHRVAADHNLGTRARSASTCTTPVIIPCSDEESRINTSECAKKDDKNRRGAFVAVPIPISSPALGTGADIMGGSIFPFSKNDRISQPSVLGGAAVFTDNGSRAFALGGELYFGEDRYHVIAGVAHGDLNYDFYGTGTIAGNAGRKFGLTQTGPCSLALRCARFPGEFYWPMIFKLLSLIECRRSS